jgi:hypothetical protein
MQAARGVRANVLSVVQAVWRYEGGPGEAPEALEAENARLRRAVADLTVDKQSLKEVAEGNY